MKVFRPTLSGSVIPVQALPLEERENRSSADKFESRTRCQIVPISNWGLASVCSTRSSLYMGKIVTRDPEILGGEPVFAGTRVPIKSLFDHLEAGDSSADFLEGFPSVKREQILDLLEESKAHALAHQ